MRIAAVADLHLANHRAWGGAVECGLNRRAREALAVLQRALERARALGCEYFMVLGDLFDSDRPTPQLLRAVQQVFEEASGLGPLVIVLRGNHDATSDAEGDGAIGPLAPVTFSVEDRARVVALDRTVDLVAVPWRSGQAREWLPATLEELLGVQASTAPFPRRVLALHLGLVDDDSPAYLRDASDAVPIGLLRELMDRHRIAFAVAGNHHQHKTWTFGAWGAAQCGTLIPHSFSDAGFDDVGKLVIYDTETGGGVVETIAGPRFVTVHDVGPLADAVERAHRDGDALYARLVVAPEELAAATEGIENAVAGGRLTGGEAIADDAGVAEQAREAAAGARRAETLEVALAEYVGRMPLAENVERAEVLERCRQLLKT